MTTRSTLLVGTAAGLMGIAIAAMPPVAGVLHRVVGTTTTDQVAAPQPAKRPAADEEPTPEGVVRMDERQVQELGIRVQPAGGGTIARDIHVPGTVTASADRLVRVPARVSGIVAELRRRPGDQVAAGDLLAVVDSREIADAKSEFLAAQRAEQLARTVFDREKRLWDRRVTAEQDFLKARADWDAARIRVDLTQQKLAALGLGEVEVSILARQPASALPRKEIRAPIAGRVTERNVDLGGAVSPETQAFVVVDLSTVWVETAVPATDLAFVREGQAVTVTGPVPDLRGEAHLIFISPTLDSQTRATRAVAEMPNPDGTWRPGIFVSATVQTAEQQVQLLLPREALQTVDNRPVVFVRTDGGFEKREVTLGRGDDRAVEVVSGLAAGELIAVTKTFLLKAELRAGSDD
ncbi:efflux RND transporter periplasmic adaptor subunit [Roseicella aerolata]|uniref:Efflux RND transporter periplasmic adaptor subunit n=1 Tax=Roseicella aerolata TaxID=2883479 RepID=A0A9X1II15_9PROT|nr:efflux RND transporter periplasmic adaptor subunit [Roseicella aerolata]MCB4824549.1 efflux RND transporter periplasmic adaptor subunit [Roseicella aerolata]